MKFRRADVRTVWVFAVVAVFVLVIVLGGVWKKFEFFTTLVSFLGFEKGVPSGSSMLGVNLVENRLDYFTGEKWINIPDENTEFVLDVYKFNPREIKGSIENFYSSTKRKPETFSVEVNQWRYWDESFQENAVRIVSKEKNGFTTGRHSEYFLNNKDDSFIDVSSWGFGEITLGFLESEINDEVLKKTISWRDSILFNGDCEKFLPLKIKFDSPSLSAKQNDDKSETFYAVRKLDEYIFVDLSKPVEVGKAQNYDKSDCFKINSYKDIDRTEWKNDAEVNFKYYESAGFDEKFESVAWDGKKWNYQSGNEKKISVDRAPDIFRILNLKDFYYGLVELAKPEGILEMQDAEFKENYMGVFVKSFQAETTSSGNSVNVDFIKGFEFGNWPANSDKKISKFVYDVLTEYNKHLLSPFYFYKQSNGKTFLYSNINGGAVFGGIELRGDNKLVISLIQEFTGLDGLPSVRPVSFEVGDFNDGKFIIDKNKVPNFGDLKIQNFQISSYQYDNGVRASLDYLDGKSSEEVVVYNG